ncbi:amino acid ABC transporter permease [Limisalsivibrio acetivorans]|uniref:amino acid ABC transporter permease n=1 Tax=Limisalsivibrio acetivorans TaxID=1304888 RepID=UPI0003B4F8D0|nr:amino acid ABC transporter permease [Limisalsivibrio acetivorans]
MSAKQKNLIWNLVLAAFLLGLCVSVYTASKNIDYIWRWHRVPKYILYMANEEVRAPFDGTAVIEKGRIIVEPDMGGDPFVVEEPGKTNLSDGDLVFEGDVVSSTKSLKMGPLLTGLLVTLWISIVSIFFAIIIGVFTGLARVSRNPAFKKLSILYVELIRGTPLLVQIFIFYFFIGTVLQLERMTAGIAALAVFAGAYIAEIVRAGIQSIPKGQMEAARSLGMSYPKAMMYVVLPQAIKRTLPPMAGQFISLIKDSSLVSVISITDLTKSGREAVASTFSPFEIWFTVALMYLVLTSGLSVLVQKLERNMARSD